MTNLYINLNKFDCLLFYCIVIPQYLLSLQLHTAQNTSDTLQFYSVSVQSLQPEPENDSNLKQNIT